MLANLGQLLWYRRGKQAVTSPTWYALPRKTAVSSSMKMDPVKNVIPENEGMAQHIKCVFEDVLIEMVHKDAQLYIIGVGEGAVEMVDYLQKDWGYWQDRVEAIAVGASHVWDMRFLSDEFKKFWGKVRTAVELCTSI